MTTEMDSSRVAIALLIIGVVVSFAAGYVVGEQREPVQREVQLPANWSPAAAAQAEVLKLCLQTVADTASSCRKTEQVAH